MAVEGEAFTLHLYPALHTSRQKPGLRINCRPGFSTGCGPLCQTHRGPFLSRRGRPCLGLWFGWDPVNDHLPVPVQQRRDGGDSGCNGHEIVDACPHIHHQDCSKWKALFLCDAESFLLAVEHRCPLLRVWIGPLSGDGPVQAAVRLGNGFTWRSPPAQNGSLPPSPPLTT